LEKYFLETYFESFFEPMMGKDDPTSAVYMIRKLEKDSGDTVKFDMFPRIADEIITDGNIEGHESSLTKYQETVSLSQYDVAVRYRGELDEKRPAWMLDEVARRTLKLRGSEVIDKICFDALQTGTYSKTFIVNGRANEAAVVAGDKLDPQTLVKAAIWGSTGGDRSQPPVQPMKINGRKTWIYLGYPDVLYDFRFDPTYNEWLRLAEKRSSDNPLFKDAKLVISSGVGEIIVMCHERMNTTTNAGSVPICQGVLLGQQALSFAFGKQPRIIRRDFQYDSQIGIDWRLIAGATKTVFNSLDWGCIGVTSAYTDLSA